MGGKTWSHEEEQIFWLKLIPHSPKRLGHDLKNKEKPWGWVAQQMKDTMGDKARRDYTELCVFEHYFQNTYLARFSPKAGRLPMKYWKAEMIGKKKKEAEKAKKAKKETKAQAEESTDSDTADESSGTLEAPIEVESAGDQDTPIEINCQYPTALPYRGGHAPISRFAAVPSAPPSFALPGSMPPPSQYYFHQFPANQYRLRDTEAEEDSLFVAPAPAPWVDAPVAAPPSPQGPVYSYGSSSGPGYGYGYHH